MTEEQKNAYRVLGLPETASLEEIRQAFDKLEERFSETNYLGSPLWDMAAEKRELIRAAYATLTQAAGQAEEASSDRTPLPGDSVSVKVRKLLNANDPDGAERLLAAEPDAETNPDYIYLRGMIAWKRGWLDEAARNVEKASALAPQNAEYKAAVEKVHAGLPVSAKLKRSVKEKGFFSACGLCLGECLCETICESACGL